MKKYAILGYPLKHTMSPPIHKRLFELDGISDYEYEILEFEKLDGGNNIDTLMALDGFNVTIPYKVDIIKYLDELHPSAERYGAVNCVSNVNGKHMGYNTDCDGFLRSAASAGASLSGKVLQCGCGGVGRMTAIEAVRHGADITLSLLPGFENTADPVFEYTEKNNLNNKITVVHPDEISGDFDLLINASPVGMFPKVEGCPVEEDIIKRCGFVYDIVYNPEVTKLISTAQKHGIKTAGGMAMLVWQAASAHEYWSGAKYEAADMEELISSIKC